MGEQAGLWERGEFTEHHVDDAVPEIELEHVPEAVTRDRPPSLTISFDSEEERAALLAQLGLKVTQRGPDTWVVGVQDPNVMELDLGL